MKEHFVEAITGRGGERLTPGEYGHLMRVGVDVPEHQRPLALLMPGEDAIASKAIGALLAIHPPQPFLDVPFTDIVAAFNFYRHAPLEDVVEVEAICETIAALNSKTAEKTPAGATGNSLLKKFLH